MTSRKTALLTFALALSMTVLVPALFARRVTIKVDTKALHAQGGIFAADSCVDSVRVLVGDSVLRAVRLYGYDKPYSATKESVFIASSLASDTIDSLRVKVDYMTMKGESLHSRELTLPCATAPGRSERILFSSWDATHTFYYYRTPPGRKQGLTPYTVLLTPLALYLR